MGDWNQFIAQTSGTLQLGLGLLLNITKVQQNNPQFTDLLHFKASCWQYLQPRSTVQYSTARGFGDQDRNAANVLLWFTEQKVEFFPNILCSSEVLRNRKPPFKDSAPFSGHPAKTYNRGKHVVHRLSLATCYNLDKQLKSSLNRW